MENSEFNTLLNKFIEETITSDELIRLKSLKEFTFYEKVLEYSSDFTVPQIKEEESYINFVDKTIDKQKEKPVIKFHYKGIIGGIAASIAILLGLFYIINPMQSFRTGVGEQLAVFLPDSSEVILHANSLIRFDKKEWAEDRLVMLQGEAYFKVKKGSTFEVDTEEGSVKVLGTQFNVNEDEDFLEVQCYEGKVAVERNGETHILTKGKAYRQIKEKAPETWDIEQEIPSWKNFESTFTNIPLSYLLETFKRVYGVNILTEGVDLQKRFSGSFPNNDMKIALETISNSMNLEYQIKNKKQIVLRAR